MIRYDIETDGTDEPPSVTDPAALAERDGVPTEQRRYEHDDADHCEAGTAGRAIVGATDAEGRLLVAAHPETGHAVLPNDTVEQDDDWAAVARDRIEGMTGAAAALGRPVLVREVRHVADGGTLGTTYHVVFGCRLADDRIVDGLCETSPWTLRWVEAVPDGVGDDDARADIERFLGGDA
jgi:hypothetical protein